MAERQTAIISTDPILSNYIASEVLSLLGNLTRCHMFLFFSKVRTHWKRVATFSLAYVLLASAYLLLVSHQYGVWQTKRQQLINESPVVWVAPYGIHYHQEKHYSRHLSSPISLYEATEREYEYCEICHPPRPAQLLLSPIWVRHWLAILLISSCLWLIVSLKVFLPRNVEGCAN